MGHGGQRETGTVLSLERDNGDLDLVTDKQFVLRVRNTVFLVTLNACVSATPGPTDFSNIAAAQVHQKTPYALGMRFSILDDDSRAFSRAFYSDLASAVPVEDALFLLGGCGMVEIVIEYISNSLSRSLARTYH